MSLKQNTDYSAPTYATKAAVASNAFAFTFSKGVSPCIISNNAGQEISVLLNAAGPASATTFTFVLPDNSTMVLPDSVGVLSGSVWGSTLTANTGVAISGWTL